MHRTSVDATETSGTTNAMPMTDHRDHKPSRHNSTATRPLTGRSSNDHSPTGHRSLRLWVSTQPGAWFMAATPALGGVIIGGATWRNLWLLIAWLLCYCVQYTGSRWMASRWSPRYRLPVLVYAGTTAVIGLPLVTLTPQILWWVPYYAVLAAITFLAAIRHQERSLWANAADVLASGMMCLIAAALGATYTTFESGTSGLGSRFLLNTGTALPWGSHGAVILSLHHPMATFNPSFEDAIGMTPGMVIIMPWLVATAAFMLSQYGSVLFIKTMIRQYGDRRYYALSIIWHVLLCVLAAMHSLIWMLAATLLLARAAIFPLRTARMKPVRVGLVETAASTMAFIVIAAFV